MMIDVVKQMLTSVFNTQLKVICQDLDPEL